MEIKNLNKVRKKRADGSFATYWYAWKGGPRIDAAPGTPAFFAAYEKAHAERERAASPDHFGAVLDEYLASEEFRKLSPRSRKDYLSYVELIRTDFGDFPIEALAEDGARGEFMKWRDKIAKRSARMADYAWMVLARVLSWARNRRRVPAHPCRRGGKLYQGAQRTDAIWTDADEAKFMAVASPQLRLAFMLALWTGQRQGDILALTWAAYDGEMIRLVQRKTGRRVVIPVGAPLKEILDATNRRSEKIVVGRGGDPFTGFGFSASFRKACVRAGVVGLTFHDIRGSTVTRLAEAGCTPIEIAAITGHSVSDVTTILDRVYLSRTEAIAGSAIRKLEGRWSRRSGVEPGKNGS